MSDDTDEPVATGSDGIGDDIPTLNAHDEQWVRDALAAVAPEAMPDAVWHRLQSAFEAEAATAATTVLPPIPAQRSVSSRWLPVAAGVAVLAVGGVLGAQALTGDGSGDNSAGSAETEAAVVVPVVQSGTAYTTTAFEEQVRSAIAPASTEVDTSPLTAAVGSPQPQIRITPTPDWLAAMDLAGCLEAVDPATDPLLVDAASYDSEAALVIGYLATPGQLDVYAVGADCSPADVQLLRYITIALT